MDKLEVAEMRRRRKRKDPLIFLPVKIIFYIFDEIFERW
jgi:hypothetical protein